MNVGVIGVGHLGQHHARIYANLPETVLAGVVDLDRGRGENIASRHDVPFFDSYQDLLPRVDAVTVAVPTSAHYPVVRDCLEAGVHVLVEKPIAVTLQEAQGLVDCAHQHGLVLQVGHSERFNPIMLAVRPYIKGPGFIECHRLSPFGERGTDVDVVLDLMIHDLDMILSFSPGQVEDVRAAGVPVLSPNIDIANARIQFSSGCVVNLTSSRVSTTRMRKIRIFQRESYISADYQSREGVIFRREMQTGEKPSLHAEPIQGGDEEPLHLQLESFAHAIKTQTKPLVSGSDGMAALDLAHQVLNSINSFVSRHAEDPLTVKE